MLDANSPINRFPHACPCCGFATLGGRGDWDICCVCWWEDDGQDNHNANVVSGGPNGKLSLARARTNYLANGISCPPRSDLREKQESSQSYERHRRFAFDSISQTIREPELNWETSIVELDDNPKNSRFKIGDRIVYNRRDLDLASRTGQIESAQWNSSIDVWHYRLIDESGKKIEQWFDGSRLQPKSVV